MNPYLAQMGQAITSTANDNLNYNVLPGINSGAVAAGGYGGSRHGIAQGLAIGQNQQGIANSLASLYGGAYEGDQNRKNTYGIAEMGDLTNRRGQDFTKETARYGIDIGRANAMMADETNRYGIDKQTSVGMANVGLGYGNLANAQQQTSNNYNLGMGNLANSQQQTANSYNLGVGGLMNNADSISLDAQRLGMDMGTTALNNSITAGNALYGSGLNELNAPANVNNTYLNQLQVPMPYTGTGYNSTPETGGGLAGAIGGGLTAAQLYQLYNQYNQP
jgi:hypothetical protein